MSQNSNTLLLFFSRPRIHKLGLLMLHNLGQGNLSEAETYADKLGVEVPQDWEAEWFNHHVSGSQEHIQLYYESGTSYELPLEFLQSLFGVGLKGAAIEVFMDQVGETYRAYFHDGKKVDKNTLFSHVKRAEKCIDAEFESGDDYQEDVAGGTIGELIEQREQAGADAMELVGTIREFSKLATETGENPLELMKSALLVRAGIRGVLHAGLFALVTILLFKGLWLWVGLSVILLVALPLIYISKESSELGFDVDSENEEYLDEDDLDEDDLDEDDLDEDDLDEDEIEESHSQDQDDEAGAHNVD